MMTFGQAANWVLGEPGRSAFAFYPSVKRDQLDGGVLFILHRPESDDADDWALEALIGQFSSDAIENYSVAPRDFKDLVPEAIFGVDLRHLRFAACQEEIAMAASWCNLSTALAMLNGVEESIAETITLTEPATIPPAWQDWLVAHVTESAFEE
jgi:hypothetical protein